MKKVNKRVGEIIFKRNFYEEEIKHLNHPANKQKRLVIKINNEKEQNKINNKTESSQFYSISTKRSRNVISIQTKSNFYPSSMNNTLHNDFPMINSHSFCSIIKKPLALRNQILTMSNNDDINIYKSCETDLARYKKTSILALSYSVFKKMNIKYKFMKNERANKTMGMQSKLYKVLCPNRNEDKMRIDFMNKEKNLKLRLRSKKIM